jgi:hypothetical protein
MRFHQFAGSTRPDFSTIGTLGRVPDLFLHYTHSDDQVRSILADGFDLGRFGQTGRKYRAYEMTRFDPRGVYAVAFEGYVDQARPFVLFRLFGDANMLSRPDTSHPGEGENIKEELARLCGCTGARLTARLLSAGIDVIQSLSEFIILDPAMIRIVRTSLD